MAGKGYARVAVPQLPGCFGELFAKSFKKPNSAKILSAGPLAFPRIYERWFSLPNFIYLWPVPLVTALLALGCWVWLSRGY